MCGIVGVMRPGTNYGLLEQDKEMFRDMLIAGAIRGEDGTGIAYVNQDLKCSTIKCHGHPYNLFVDKKFKTFWKGVSKKCDYALFGHNRYATTGKISNENTHPFVHKHIVLVHNGTLEKGSEIELKRADVDSHALAIAIAEQGVDAAISKTSGAYAIVFYNQQTKTMNFLRNYQRPLYMGINPSSDFVAFASESGMLQWMGSRNHLTKFDIKEIPANKLFTIDLKTGHSSDKQLFGKAPATSYAPGVDLTGTASSYPKASNNVVPYVPKAEKLPAREPLHSAPIMGWKKAFDWRNLSKGSAISVRIDDYIDQDIPNERYILIGKLEAFPDARVQFAVKSEKLLDLLFDQVSCMVEVQNIVEPKDATVDGQVGKVIWAKLIVDQFGQPVVTN